MHLIELQQNDTPDIGIDIIISVKRLAMTFVLFDNLRNEDSYEKPDAKLESTVNGTQRMYMDVKSGDILKKVSCYKTCCQCIHPFQDLSFNIYEGNVDTTTGDVEPSKKEAKSTLIFSKFPCCPPQPLCCYLPLYSAQVYDSDGSDKVLKYDITSNGGIKYNMPCCYEDAPIVINDSNKINIGSLSSTTFCNCCCRDIFYERSEAGRDGALFSKYIIDICGCCGKKGHPVGFRRTPCCYCDTIPFAKETVEIRKGNSNLNKLDDDGWLWLTFFEEVVYPYSPGNGAGGDGGGGGGGF